LQILALKSSISVAHGLVPGRSQLDSPIKGLNGFSVFALVAEGYAFKIPG